MNYENAKKGIGQIFTAEILQLLAAIMTVVGAIITVVGVATVAAAGIGEFGATLGGASEADLTAIGNAATLAGVGTIGGSVLTIVGAIIAFIGFILYIVGVGNASKDEDGFKKAMLFLVLALVCSIVGSFTGGVANGVLAGILTILGAVFDLLSAIYVINGIISLANKTGNSKVEAKGRFTLKLILVILIMNIIVSLIGLFVNVSAIVVIAGVLNIIAAILSVVRYFVYLSLLSNAKKMFN